MIVVLSIEQKPVPVCPVCGSPEVERLDYVVPASVLLPEMRESLICLNCDAIYSGPEDLVRV